MPRSISLRVCRTNAKLWRSYLHTIGQTETANFQDIFNRDGIVLSKLLGICPLLNKSRQIDAAWKMGVAVIIVTTLSTALNWLVYHRVLVKCSDLLAKYSSLPIRLENIFYLPVFIVTIAVFLQLLSLLLRKFANTLY